MIPTEILAIKKGIPKLPGDENSAESDIETFALHLDNAPARTAVGFSLNPNIPWQPERAVVKQAQWIDSNRVDGRTLTGNAVANVRETINITAKASTHLDLVRRVADLQRLAEQARLFHASFHQIDPVYLEWAMRGGKGSQYALIYDIEIAATYHDNGDGGASASLVLVIEREPAWRGIPPGAHPRHWTYYWRNLTNPDYTEYDPANATLPALLSYTIANANEFQNSDGYRYPSLAKNYIDIPAADIPGDAPALVMVHIDDVNTDLVRVNEWFISRSTKPESPIGRDGNTYGRIYAVPVADTTSPSPPNLTPVADSSAPRRQSDGQRTAMRTNVSGSGQGLAIFELDALTMRGQYNIYVRGKFTGSVSSGTLEFTLDYKQKNLTNYQVVGEPITSVDGLYYLLGAGGLPAHSFVNISPDGRGIEGGVPPTNTTMSLFFDNQTGVEFDIYDILFIPFDEPSVRIDMSNVSSDQGPDYYYDSSTYLTHGEPGHLALSELYDRLRGDVITLTPNAYNSLVFFIGNVSTAEAAEISYNVEIDIVPRWYGIRDA